MSVVRRPSAKVRLHVAPTAVVLWLCIALLVAGCRGRRTPPTSVLRRALAVEPTSLPGLDPSDGYARFVSSYVYQGLTSVDPDTGRVSGRLAEHLDVSADGRRITAWLRAGVRFHDGSALKTDDVLASFRFVLDAAGPARRLRDELGGLEGIEAAGPSSVVLSWPRPWFRAQASLSLVPIVPARSVAAGAASWARQPPPGTGPFRIDRWRRGELLELLRFDAGWGAHAALDGIRFRMVPDPSTQLTAFRAGQLDLVNADVGGFLAVRSELESDPRWRVFTYSSPRVDVLFFNNRSGPCRDRVMRTAIAEAIDRTTMARAFSGGLNRPVRGPVLPGDGGLTGFDAPAVARPEVARAAVAALPHAAGSQALVLRVAAGGAERRQVSEAIRAQLAGVGLDVRVQASDFGALLSDVHQGRFDLVLLQVAVGADEDPWDSWHSQGSANFARYANPAVDALLDEARVTMDGRARTSRFARVAGIIDDDRAAVYLWRVGVVTLVDSRLQGVQPPHLGIDDVLGWRWLAVPGAQR